MVRTKTLTPEEKRELEEFEGRAVYQIENGYFSIKAHSEGWDFNFYNRNMVIEDGDVYDEYDLPIGTAIDTIIKDENIAGKESLLARTVPMFDFDDFMEQAKDCEEANLKSKKRDREFEESNVDSFAIYQLKDSDYTRNFRFEGSIYLVQKGTTLQKCDFNNVYVGPLSKIKKNFITMGTKDLLNAIHILFNVNPPEGFDGYSPSVGNIIAIKENGKTSYHFVDKIGFKEISYVQDTVVIAVTIQEMQSAQISDYMMLGKMQQDCNVHLSVETHRRIEDPSAHIEEMKRLWNWLVIKPQWLSYEDILEYEKQLCDPKAAEQTVLDRLPQIETGVWEPIPEKKGTSRYVSQRKTNDVFNEVKTALFDIISNPVFDFSPDLVAEIKSGFRMAYKCPEDFPKGLITSNALFGSSEGIYLDVAVTPSGEEPKTMFIAKVYEQHASEFLQIQKIAGLIYLMLGE